MLSLKYLNLSKYSFSSVNNIQQLRLFLTCKFPELSEFPSDIDSYKKLHKYSIENPEHFWSTLAKSRLEWMKPFEKVKNDAKFSDLDNFNLKWFLNGKLNVSGRILVQKNF